ncbi:MAG: transposase, partial [Burkholderiales bacterium]
MLPRAKRRGRPRTALRLLVEGIFYVVKTGCQWRWLPAHFPPRQPGYHHFRAWSREGILRALN